MSGARRSQRPVWLGTDKRQWDHARLHLQMLEDDRLQAIELAVYFGLAAHAELNSGEAYPAADTLASYCGLGERRVRMAIKNLERAGYIACEQVKGKASRYYLRPMPSVPPDHLPDHPRWATVDTASHPSTPASGAGVEGSANEQTPAPDDTDPGTTYRSSPASGADELEPVEPEPRNDENPLRLVEPPDTKVDRVKDEFVELVWNPYPRHPKGGDKGGGGTRQVALNAYRRLPIAERARVRQAVPHYAAWCKGTDTWPVYCEKFINTRRWEQHQDPPTVGGQPPGNRGQDVDYVTGPDGVTRARFYGNA